MAPTALPPKEMPLVRFMAAGGIAGIASRSATAPLETLKIIAQVIVLSTLYYVYIAQVIVLRMGHVQSQSGIKHYLHVVQCTMCRQCLITLCGCA